MSIKTDQDRVQTCSLLMTDKGEEEKAEKLERIGINDKKGGADQQRPGSKQWRQARWLQGTQHPAKYGQQDPALAYFLYTKALMMQEEPYIDSGWQRRLLSL